MHCYVFISLDHCSMGFSQCHLPVAQVAVIVLGVGIRAFFGQHQHSLAHQTLVQHRDFGTQHAFNQRYVPVIKVVVILGQLSAL